MEARRIALGLASRVASMLVNALPQSVFAGSEKLGKVLRYLC